MPIIAVRSDPVSDVSAFSELLADLPGGCDDVFAGQATGASPMPPKRTSKAGSQLSRPERNEACASTTLYGGYLSVLLTARGLAGINHGVGYTESRDSRRLSATGAPPARYYIPILREFFTVPNAQPVIDHLPADWSCSCRVCDQVRDEAGRPQVGRLNTEELKRHFLICRHEEFVRVDASLNDDIADLERVGNWVVNNERDFLPALHGERASWRGRTQSSPADDD